MDEPEGGEERRGEGRKEREGRDHKEVSDMMSIYIYLLSFIWRPLILKEQPMVTLGWPLSSALNKMLILSDIPLPVALTEP